jgi:hypothetical protein
MLGYMHEMSKVSRLKISERSDALLPALEAAIQGKPTTISPIFHCIAEMVRYFG